MDFYGIMEDIMKLSINGIKNTTDWEKAGIKLPSYDVEKIAENTKKSPVWIKALHVLKHLTSM